MGLRGYGIGDDTLIVQLTQLRQVILDGGHGRCDDDQISLILDELGEGRRIGPCCLIRPLTLLRHHAGSRIGVDTEYVYVPIGALERCRYGCANEAKADDRDILERRVLRSSFVVVRSRFHFFRSILRMTGGFVSIVYVIALARSLEEAFRSRAEGSGQTSSARSSSVR